MFVHKPKSTLRDTIFRSTNMSSEAYPYGQRRGGRAMRRVHWAAIGGAGRIVTEIGKRGDLVIRHGPIIRSSTSIGCERCTILFEGAPKAGLAEG
jgi:hypothetical protein